MCTAVAFHAHDARMHLQSHWVSVQTLGFAGCVTLSSSHLPASCEALPQPHGQDLCVQDHCSAPMADGAAEPEDDGPAAAADGSADGADESEEAATHKHRAFEDPETLRQLQLLQPGCCVLTLRCALCSGIYRSDGAMMVLVVEGRQ